MTPLRWTVLLFVAVCLFVVSAQWRGNFGSRTICRYVSKRVCAYKTWRTCCYYKRVRVPEYYTQYFCLPGWEESENNNCDSAICNPECKNGGTCTRPNICSCTRGYSGPTCEGKLCSHKKPCYPGVCSRSPSRGDSVCSCSVGFRSGDNGCKELLSPYQEPDIFEYKVRIAQYEPTKQMEMYGLLLDTSSVNKTVPDEMWTNRRDFNQFNYTGIAFFDPQRLSSMPSEYIRNSSLGIVGGKFSMIQTKLDGRTVPNPFKNFKCPDTATRDSPAVGIFNCSVVNPTFDARIDSGDTITITFTARAGGYRQLINIDSKAFYKTEYYKETSITKTLKFLFDAMPPVHCYPDCFAGESPLEFGEEYKTSPVLNLRWGGWNDTLSGVQRYAWEVFRLTANGDGDLREINPLEPIIIKEIEHSENIPYPTYTFAEPGLYSIILQIADRANNSQYVRRFCLYDPNSNIQLSDDVHSALRVDSASSESNYTWQADVNGRLDLDWTNYFFNSFLEDNKLLNKILEYPVQFVSEGPTEMKKVINKFKNTEGRTESAVQNARGVTHFQMYHHQDSNGGKSQPTIPPSWINFTNPISTRHTLNLTVNNGDTVVVWIKATDATGHERTEKTQVNFDSTGPEISGVSFDVKSGGTDGQSRLTCLAKDMDSGISVVSWKAVRLDTNTEYSTGTIPWPQPEECTDPRECMCLDKFGQCFTLEAQLVINNCDLVRNIPDISVSVNLHVDIMNQAMIHGETQIFKIEDVKTLSGYESCFYESVNSEGLSGGGTAGIIIVVLLLVIIGIMVFLFITNRRPFTKDTKDRGLACIQNILNTHTSTDQRPASTAYPNNAYSADDDIYLCGGADAGKEQSWQIHHLQLTLLGTITTGRFAKICQAKIKSKTETVAAKMLKEGYSEDDETLMKAKVNYMASQLLKHPNILEFIGAVVDNDTLGPVIVVEYCELGQLDKWLITQRGDINPDVIETLQHLCFGISKGMTYLASKKIVHRKLAARNVLMTFLKEPKITGFGPSKASDEDDESSKEMIPLKWTAIECLVSLKGATERSDVWSYGIVLWEIFSLGETPYPDMKSREVESKVKSGYRMSKPELCEEFYHKLMMSCWSENPKRRHSFKKITEKISETFSDKSGDDIYHYR